MGSTWAGVLLAAVLVCCCYLPYCAAQEFRECRDTACITAMDDECTNDNNVNRFCSTGFQCLRFNSTRRNCVADATSGQECTSSSDCVGDATTCNADSSFLLAAGVKKCGRPGIPGDTCTANYECAEGTGRCVTQRCEAIPDGQACSGWGSNDQCSPGSFCFSPDGDTPGVCARQSRLGEACRLKDDGTANCESGLVCDATVIPFTFSLGVCRRAFSLPPGSATTSDDLCTSGVSSGGLCLAFPDIHVGQQCADDSDCTTVGSCVCTLALQNNGLRCQLRNEFFLRQPALRELYNVLVSAIVTHKCHFTLEPHDANCFMREFHKLGARYYCGQWLYNFNATARYPCDTTITAWCAANAPEISARDPLASLLAVMRTDPIPEVVMPGISAATTTATATATGSALCGALTGLLLLLRF